VKSSFNRQRKSMTESDAIKPIAILLPKRPEKPERKNGKRNRFLWLTPDIREEYERQKQYEYEVRKWRLFSGMYGDAISVLGLRYRYVYAGDPVDLDNFSGIVLSGGRDINPARYGADRRPETGDSTDARDEEIGVFLEALRRGIPVLGICRGMQVMAVALDCHLEQHLPDTEAALTYKAKTGKTVVHEYRSRKDWINKAAQKPPRGWFTAKLRERMLAPGHVVEVKLGSALHRITGLPRFRTTGLHHQGLTDENLVDGVVPVARTADDFIEAIELSPELIRKITKKRDLHPFCIGVQWHPERRHFDRPQTAIFSAFGQAVRLTAKYGPDYAAQLGPHETKIGPKRQQKLNGPENKKTVSRQTPREPLAGFWRRGRALRS
jgi:putative glutamine amidotransferase